MRGSSGEGRKLRKAKGHESMYLNVDEKFCVQVNGTDGGKNL
jgi:hypothetical protein